MNAIASVALCLGLCGFVFAQAPIVRRPPADEPVQTLQLASRLVSVAVNAVDSGGAPVGGLEQSDFRILEDGKEQKISFFDKESSTPLSIVLAIDGSQSLARNERLAKEAAKHDAAKAETLDLFQLDRVLGLLGIDATVRPDVLGVTRIFAVIAEADITADRWRRPKRSAHAETRIRGSSAE